MKGLVRHQKLLTCSWHDVKIFAGFNSCWLHKKHVMIMGTLGHLLSLRMQSIVGNVTLRAWNFNGFKVCWIQPLLDSSFVGFNLWWIQG